MCINRSGDDAFVTQQTANGLELCAVVEHGRGETMAKHVRRFLLLCGDGRKRCSHHRAEGGISQSMTAGTEEQCIFVGREALKKLATDGEIIPKRVGQFSSKRNDSLFVAFTRHTELRRREVYIPQIQSQNLSGTESGVIKQEKKGAITTAGIVLSKPIITK